MTNSPSILINNTEIQTLDLQNQRVISLSLIDKVHERPEGTARRTFNTYRDKLIESAGVEPAT